jgi:hypothetical protein
MSRWLPLFHVDALPDEARDTLFRAFTYDTAARACCVSRAWNRAFGTHARHLWAELVFDARHLGVPLTDAVVRGVAAKARDALTSITMPETLLFGPHGQAGGASSGLVLSLCASHPALTHVLLPDADARVVREVLHASSTLTCLEVGRLWLSPEEVTYGDALAVLTHPALRVRRLHVHYCVMAAEQVGGPHGLLTVAAAAMQTQTDWLEAVSVTWDNMVAYQVDDDGAPEEVINRHPTRAGENRGPNGVAAFVAAVAACGRLAEVNAPRMLTADAFSSVMEALVMHNSFTAERVAISVEPVDGEHYLPAVLHHLPRLARLSLVGAERFPHLADTDALAYDAAMRALAVHLPSAPALRHLVITGGDSLSCDACAALFTAVAASGVTELELRGASAHQLRELARSGLPPGLTSLTVANAPASPGLYGDPDFAHRALVALLHSAAHVRSLSFVDCAWSSDNVWAVAKLLASSNCRVRRLTLTNVDSSTRTTGGDTQHHWGPLTSALWVNSTLEELSVSPVHDDCAGAFADGIRGARGLRKFTAGVALADGSVNNPRGGNWLGPCGMGLLAEGFRYNSTLRSLCVVAHTVQRVSDLGEVRNTLLSVRKRRAERGRGTAHDEVHVSWAGASQR